VGELIKAYPILTLVITLFAPVIAVVVSSYLQSRRMSDKMDTERNAHVVVIEEQMKSTSALLSKQITSSTELMDAKLKGTVTWEKYDNGIKHVHERVGVLENGIANHVKEVVTSVHEIELHTKEISGEVNSLKNMSKLQHENINKLETRITKFEDRRGSS